MYEFDVEDCRWKCPGRRSSRYGPEFQGHSALPADCHDVAMHELAISLSIIDIVEEELRRLEGDKVRAVHVSLGPLAGVAKEALSFSFGLACEGTALEGAHLVIEDSEANALDITGIEIET